MQVKCRINRLIKNKYVFDLSNLNKIFIERRAEHSVSDYNFSLENTM